MDFGDWCALTNRERTALSVQWNGYEEGCWRGLLKGAADSLAADLRDVPWVSEVQNATHHGGFLVLGVVTSLRYGEPIDLPSLYFGFPVIPFVQP